MKYVIASMVGTDEIRFADGRDKVIVAGGAGIYALCGVKLWEDDVLLATGVGEDYWNLYESWYHKNQLSMDGLIAKDEKTPYNIIQYFEDGEREETPLYGLDHFTKIETTPEDLKKYFDAAKGIYIFKNSHKEYWDQILEYKKHSNAVLMWEIANDATYFNNLEAVKRIAQQVDILSINMTEARNLLGEESLDKIVKTLQSWKLKLVFLRRGSKGAVMITPEDIVEVPAESNVTVVDTTGGGNSSSGAVMYGFCEGYSLEVCGKMGSISAAMCISQYGVPDKITKKDATAVKETVL